MLDELEAAHAVVGGARRARTFARQQVNQAYVVLLASQFQRFCRDLFSDSIDALATHPPFAALAPVFNAALPAAIRLNSGNANPTNIAADFGRFGFDLWKSAIQKDPRTAARREKLEALNRWRNAFAHQDFRNPQLRGRETIRIRDVRAWRTACDCLAVDFDAVLRLYLESITGIAPW
ncbi:hypothetical protein [Longimicrobium sp.]|uniref:hypothetical protein n=1 Tax=Longimicrobium sp. TaxID=2029185 RepID=UPI002BDC8027|nr:hypothetical protein [Longimicrobium sp.]HSU12660.1 hypothetical protein [Longimicrobium sp.]